MAAREGPDIHSSFLVLEGRSAAPGRVCGPLVRNGPDRGLDEVAGSILVAERAVPDDVPRLLAAGGTLTLGGSLLSHVSLLSHEFGRPSVCLRDELLARLVLDESTGVVLRVSSVVGGGPPVLHEGDIVFLDGDAGRVLVPGGLNRTRANAVRGVWTALQRYAADPSVSALEQLAKATAAADDTVLEFALHAAILFDTVPDGAPRMDLIDRLVRIERVSRRRTGEGRLLTRVREDALTSIARLRSATAEVSRPDELDRQRARLDRLRGRVEARIADLSADAEALAELWAVAESEIDAHHDRLRRTLRDEVVRAGRLADATIATRLNELHGLIGRATDAGVVDPELERLRVRVSERFANERAVVGDQLVVPVPDTPSGVSDRSLVGGKAFGLLEVSASLPDDCTIPRGFVVTTAAYRMHLVGETGARLREIVVGGEDAASASRAAKAAILAAEIPEPVIDAVGAALTEFGDVRFAVRSSSTHEDGPSGSLAGQFDSWLGVGTFAELLDRMRWCWASTWNVRAIRTLAALGRTPLDAHQAVLVQEVVETRAAGALLTHDRSGKNDCMLVNAAWGLGEGISHGSVPGDLFWVRRSDGKVHDVEVSPSTHRIVLDPNHTGTVERPIPEELRERPCLDGSDLVRLARLARALEATSEGPREIEFGFANGDDRLVVFQVRRLPNPAE